MDTLWGEMDDYAGLMGYVQTPYHNTWSIPEIIARLQRSRRKKEGSKQTGQSMRKRPKRRSRQTGQSMRKRLKRPPAKLTTVGNRNMVSNYFTQFPLEILELILANTPTDEVKSLGRTSKGLNMIIPSRLGQYFWVSRFQDPFEYGCVFEAQTHKAELDWKVLYFSITKA